MSSLWVEATDPSTNRVYYYNKDTKQTQWTRPTDLEETKTQHHHNTTPTTATTHSAADDDAASWAESVDGKTGRKYYYNRVTKTTSWSKPKCMLQQATAVVDTTTAAATNTVVSRTTPSVYGTVRGGTAPGSAASSKPGSPSHSRQTSTITSTQQLPRAPAPSMASEWVEAKDPSTGRSYWYNKDTKETTWSAPITATIPATTTTAAAAPPTTSNYNTLSSSTTATASIHNTATAGPVSYSYSTASTAASRQGTLKPGTTTDLSRAMAAIAVADDEKDDEKPKMLKKAESIREKKDLHSILDMDGHDDDDDDDNGGDQSNDSGDNGGGSSSGGGSSIEATTQNVRAQLEAGDGSNGTANLHFAKHRKGWFKRTFRVGKEFTHDKLMSYKKSLIKKSLLKENRHLDTVAVQLFKNVMSYMGDRKSSKGCKEHCKKIIRQCLAAPTGIRDECYVQLMKQTTHNPNKSSEKRGWELLTQCLCFFPPSKMIVDSVRDYIEKAIVREGGQVTYLSNEANQRVIAATTREAHSVLTLAYLALIYLPQVQALGARLNVPCEYELAALVDFTSIYINIYTANDCIVEPFLITPFTTVRSLQVDLCNRLHLTSAASLFALYESQGKHPILFLSEKEAKAREGKSADVRLADTAEAMCDTAFYSQRKLNEEQVCDSDGRVLDVVSNWENTPLVEEMSDGELGDEGYNSAFVRKDKDQLYKRNKKELNQLNLEELYDEKRHREGTHNIHHFNRLLFRLHTVCKLSEPELSKDAKAIPLLFAQLYRDVVIERYPCVEKDVSTLSALWLQSCYGNYNESRSGLKQLAVLAEKFIPWSALPAAASADTSLYGAVVSKYKKLANFSPYESMLSYVDYCQSNPLYGMQCCYVEQRQFNEHPNILLLGVTCEGVLFLHPGNHLDRELLAVEATGEAKDSKGGRDREKERERRDKDRKDNKLKVLENFAYSDIVTWGHSDEKFILVIGNIIQQRKLILKTKQGKYVNALIHEYVKRKVASRERATSK